jgi:hypothetical protein
MSSRRGRDADMAENTPSDGSVAEPALVYNAGERRTHAEHAAEAYDSARRADDLERLSQSPMPDFTDEDAYDDWSTNVRRYRRAANNCRERAQWHATMAVYHAIVDQGRR